MSRTTISRDIVLKLLDQQITKKTAHLGMFDGLCGLSILCFLVAKGTNDINFEQKGKDLLDIINDKIVNTKNPNFRNGLAGIGWAIEWLAQNNILENVNTNEILEDVDNWLYKLIMYSTDTDVSLKTGILGRIAYFHIRELSCNADTHRFSTIIHQECLILLTDDLHRLLVEEKRNLIDQAPVSINRKVNTLTDLGDTLLVVSKIGNINRPTVENILDQTISYSIKLLEKYINNEKHIKNEQQLSYHYTVLHLAICYLIAGKNFSVNSWVRNATSYINLLLQQPAFCIDHFENLRERNLFRKLKTYTLLNCLLPNPSFSDEVKKLIDLLGAKELKCSLVNGIGDLIVAKEIIEGEHKLDNLKDLIFFA